MELYKKSSDIAFGTITRTVRFVLFFLL